MVWRHKYISAHYWRHWDNEKFVLFNAESAQTHQLNPFAADILALLQYQPLDITELSKRLTDQYEEIEFDTEVIAYLHETLGLLDDLGLIEPESM